MTNRAQENTDRGPYEDVASLRESTVGGEVVGVITARKFGSVTRYSFAIHREYVTPEGERKRTTWFDARHMDAHDAVMDRIEETISKFESATKRTRRNREAQ